MDSKGYADQLIINQQTLFLESKPVGKKTHTLIYSYNEIERNNSTMVINKKVEVPKSPIRVIDHNLQNMVSSYESSLKSSQKHLEKLQRHKLPLVVGNYRGTPLVLFPIFSPDSKQNIWVHYNNVLNIEIYNHRTTVIFKNEQQLDLPIQKNTLVQQMASSGVLYNIIHREWLKQYYPFK